MDKISMSVDETFKSGLEKLGEVRPGPRAQDLTLRLFRAEEVKAAAIILRNAGFSLATLVATDETETDAQDLKVRYIFEPRTGNTVPLQDIFITLMASLDPLNPVLPSLSEELPAANWHEREAHDLFGILFTGHPDPKPLIVHDGWPENTYPLRKKFDAGQCVPVEPAVEFPHLVVEGEGVFEVPVGPVHAGIIEPGHFRFSTIGEKVLHLEPRLFYTHRGLEKRVEGLTVINAFYVAERMCGVCSVSHGLGFCEAAEQIAKIEIPRRAKFIRTLALELERLYNHVGDVGNISAGASYHYGTSVGARMKEALQQVNEALTGHRFLRGLIVPGGVLCDLTGELTQSILRVVASTEEALDNLTRRIDNNPSILDRLDTTGILSQEDALNLAVTGIAARASGIDRDARRDHPHGAYGDPHCPFVNVITDDDGDVHARFIVRTKEAKESIRLIRELLKGLPSGAVYEKFPDLLPPSGTGLCAIESPRGASIHWLRSDVRGHIDRYHLRSASYANWPALPFTVLKDIIPDFPIINKSFELCYACTDR